MREAYRQVQERVVSLRPMDPNPLAEGLASVLGEAFGAPVSVEALVRLPGGASKQTWSFTARTAEGTERRLILRADRGGPRGSGMDIERSVLSAAARAGVPVPAIVAGGDGDDALGMPYLVTEFVDGETIARRILRDESLREARRQMAHQCGAILARIHSIPPDEVTGLTSSDPLEQMRSQLDQLAQPHPAFELGLLWLESHRPGHSRTGVVHGDFRNGNLIVGPDGVRAVLDWEITHLGDPLEDLAWICVRAWRFGSPLTVGGFGTIDQLVAGYEEAGGEPVERDALHWWIVAGTLRWGIICIAQAFTHLSGAYRSVELAAIGRRVCEVESDLLELLPSGEGDVDPHVEGPRRTDWAPHDAPSAPELLDAVHDFLEADAIAATQGSVRFHLRVAANVIAMVRREIELGGHQLIEHARRLEELGVRSEEELAAAIRDGVFSDRLDEVTDAVRATVTEKLAVANPRYRDDRPVD